MTVDLIYYVTFGKGDSSECMDWMVDLTDEEEAIYKNAIENGLSLECVEGLEDALSRAYEEIEEEEIYLGIENEYEYVLECQGKVPMETDELNRLVAERDPHALEFFGLTNASDEEIENWDADNLTEIPLVCDFDEEFEPYSPFDEGWGLTVAFAE